MAKNDDNFDGFDNLTPEEAEAQDRKDRRHMGILFGSMAVFSIFCTAAYFHSKAHAEEIDNKQTPLADMQTTRVQPSPAPQLKS